MTSVGLLYTTLSTQDGVLNIPNGALLAVAVGPLPREMEPPAQPTQQLVFQRP